MLRGLIAAAVFAVSSLGGMAQAGERAVVIELYTSQGCSSCPPADALLHELAQRDDVIPLALHVDYWDYIGWKDEFARPEHTTRQKAYAHAAGQRTIYTPQMIVGGRDHVVGYKPMRLAELIEQHRSLAQSVEITLTRDGANLTVAAVRTAPTGQMVVQLVQYQPSASVSIRRGENKGRTLDYANIVTDWQVLDNWDGAEPLSLQAEVDAAYPVVVLVQEPGAGAILAAARLR
ncbi:hypothetical protein AIOL_001973 [Candidatus Rhodobacter oscarellae]|uniref:Secreted protein n=1 Tax=Candidatus Rhodobacter oscarellae TaxID=1675527 RepID=A0A0J9E2P9_9RHOB|nr:DUF1223 domain-containing protein [Candidatus Rhodobacter lobularis]KMW57015.1 hypothetical protein AIOL_001973 [Candidatus Rhodobacter lobularis]